MKRTIKKYYLKEDVKIFLGCFLTLAVLILLLNIQDEHERKKAIERCNGEKNIITLTDNNGDRYYRCKNEK